MNMSPSQSYITVGNERMVLASGNKAFSIGCDPEVKRLAAAILRQAVRDVLSQSEEEGREEWCADAMRWFLERGRTHPGSLEWVCQILAIDPEGLRQRCRGCRPS